MEFKFYAALVDKLRFPVYFYFVQFQSGDAMKINSSLLLALVLCLFLTASPASPQDENAKVYVVHGIPGLDFGLSPELPLDISVDGECIFQAIKFGDIMGPISKPPGVYRISVGLANPVIPCGIPLYEVDVPLMAGETSSLVIHMDPEGAPTAHKFSCDFSPLVSKKVRIILLHTAAVSAVDVTLTRTFGKKPYVVMVEDFNHCDKMAVEVRSKSWRMEFALPEMGAPLYSKKFKFKDWSAYLLFAVGTVESGTLKVLMKRVKGLKPPAISTRE